MKLFKINPGLAEESDYFLTITIAKTFLIFSVGFGKFVFILDTDAYYDKSMPLIESLCGDMPKNCRKTWYYILQLKVYCLRVIFQITLELKIHEDRPMSLNELIEAAMKEN